MSKQRNRGTGKVFPALITGIFLGLILSSSFVFVNPLHSGWWGSDSDKKQDGTTSNSAGKTQESTASGSPPTICLPDFTELSRKISPTVVNISTTQTVKGNNGFRGFQFHGPGQPFGPRGQDPLEDFFERFVPHGDMKRKSLGSGFIIDKEGYIVTNNHVIQEADSITVIFKDETEATAKVVGKDPKTDVALIKVEVNRPLPEAPLGDSSTLDVGDWVLAIGNPFGLKDTLTAGIVSAIGREIGAGPYDDFIQTDASINPGNSGGPLLDMNGNVVGINTAIIAGGTGIGFAIPINVAKGLLPQLKDTGHISRGWLGVIIQHVTPELAKSFGLKEPRGALVSEVVKDGPAEGSGLKPGDIVVEYEGKAITGFSDLPKMVAVTAPGTKVSLKVIRNGSEKTFHVKLGLLPDEEATAGGGGGGGETGLELGLELQEITPDLARSHDLPADKGLIVTGIAPDGSAAEAGIRAGDIIQEINQNPIETVKEFQNAVRSAPTGSTLLFRVKRQDGSLFIPVEKK
jgi:serine protease Do